MKTLILILCACLFMVACSNNDPLPSPTNPPATPGLLDTLTAGWALDSLAGRPEVFDISFINSSLGYLSDETGISKSTDGGHTWSHIFDYPAGINIATTPDGKIFMVGFSTKIYSSTNGGASFDSIDLVGSGYLKDIFFTDNNNGFTRSSSLLYQTTNGGISWNQISSDIQSSGVDINHTLFFLDANTGFTASANCSFYSSGSINNWEQSLTTFPPNDFSGFTGVYATDANSVFLTNRNAEIYKSTDGGKNYSLLSSLPFVDTYYTDIQFIDSNTGYMCYANKVYKTTNGGVSWQVVATVASTKFNEVYFLDANHGWACGENGTILIYNQ